MRRHLPRFSEENFPKNVELIHQLENLAKRKGCTPGQVGIAWVKAQSERNGNPVIIPIPGATTAERVKENLTEVELSENDLKEVDSILAGVEIHGERYHGEANSLNFGDSPAE
jgi:pyridoxine 4-dehydrogenase